MTFVPGQPKPANSGRRKGTPNKKTVLRVSDVLAEKGINPTEKILELLPKLKESEQIHVWFELLSYLEPKPAPEKKDEDDPGDAGEDLTTEQILDMVRDVTPRIGGGE